MPTLTAWSPVPPSTSELLCSTKAWEPIAVALWTSVDASQELPMQVRSLPVVTELRASNPTAVFADPVVLACRAEPPKAELRDADTVLLPHELLQLLLDSAPEPK